MLGIKGIDLRMLKKRQSPYLKDANRLGDVISAIQAMATYKFYKLDFKGWADRVSADESKADCWKTIFIEHPEFFRLDSEKTKASLVWRRQRQKLYDVDNEEKITKEEYKALPQNEKHVFQECHWIAEKSQF